MKQKRYRRSIVVNQNWDSFLDVLTNTVGVLIFVCLFSSLVTAESTMIVRTPLESGTDKSPNFYECSANRVRPLNNKEAREKINQFMQSLPEPNLYNLSNILEKINQFKTQTSHYGVHLQMQYSSDRNTLLSKTIYKPLKASSGDTVEQIHQIESEFQQSLKALKQDEDYLAFLVREDCFSAFRNARQVAWKAGFQVGWEPLASGSPISFTTGGNGRRVGVQ